MDGGGGDYGGLKMMKMRMMVMKWCGEKKCKKGNGRGGFHSQKKGEERERERGDREEREDGQMIKSQKVKKKKIF